MNKLIALLVSVTFSMGAYSQIETNIIIDVRGVVYDSSSKTPLPFATIVNQSSNTATITNSEGYFELKAQSLVDTVYVSYIGYKKRIIGINSKSKIQKIALEINPVNLSAVNIFPEDNSFIYDLILAAKEKQSNQIKNAKVYYQLKSFIDGSQIELVESFYNASIQGYDLINLKLKTGRLGIKKRKDSYFASLESSKPIRNHRLFSESDYFPHSPLELNKRNMKKKYYLDLEQVYLDENKDSIVVAYFIPKKSKSYHFNARVWINASDTSIIKVELEGENIYEFPLIPVYQSDKLSDVNLKITKTFQEINGEMFFKHIDFNYDFIYTKGYGESYRVNTQAVLFSYDYDELFSLPITHLNDSKLTDYQKLSAMPYNEFFWNNNDELRLHYENDSNELFIQDELTVSNVNYLNKLNNNLGEIFNYTAIKWSKNRFSINELPQKTPYIIGQPTDKFEAQIFLDYNLYKDSINVLTQSIFDLYKSYYRYYIDNKTNCYFNMYFDLVEIERKRLAKAIESSDRSLDSVNRYFNESQNRLEDKLYDFLEGVSSGKNEEQMKNWNELIKTNFGIDNLSIFGIYQE